MVIQKDLNGNEIRTYRSLREAHRITGINRSTISKHLRGEREHAGGYLWDTMCHFNTNESKNMHSTYDDILAEEGYTREEVSSVKIWQTMRGETRYSIVVKTDEEEVNTLKEDFLKDLQKFKPEHPVYKYKKQKDPVAIMIGIPDAHISKLVEGADNWNIDKAVEVFMKTIQMQNIQKKKLNSLN